MIRLGHRLPPSVLKIMNWRSWRVTICSLPYRGSAIFYSGNLANESVQFHLGILHSEVIGSPTTLGQNHSFVAGFHFRLRGFVRRRTNYEPKLIPDVRNSRIGKV